MGHITVCLIKQRCGPSTDLMFTTKKKALAQNIRILKRMKMNNHPACLLNTIW